MFSHPITDTSMCQDKYFKFYTLNEYQLNLGAKFVFSWFAKLAETENVVWPANEHIAHVLNMSVRSVKYHTKILERLGLITKQKHPGMRNVYTVHIP